MRGRIAAASLALLFDGCASTEAELSPAAVERARAASEAMDGDRLRSHVVSIVERRKQETPQVSPYNEQEPLSRVDAGKYVTEAFGALGLAPVVETAALSVGESRTIYADISGERPQLVLVTGHYDAWFQAGADDNASALAVLLEAARVLKDTRPKRTIRVVAFDREEEGIIGSVGYFAAHRADDVRVVLNMDCVGYASREAGSQDTPPGLALRDRGDFLAVIANAPAEADLTRFVKLSAAPASSLDTLGLLVPGDSRTAGTGAFLQSDHVPFWLAGIPALFLTDTAYFRNPNYHTKEDLPETLDYAFLASVGRLVAGAAAAFAEDD